VEGAATEHELRGPLVGALLGETRAEQLW
jgi:hypothetical protein